MAPPQQLGAKSHCFLVTVHLGIIRNNGERHRIWTGCSIIHFDEVYKETAQIRWRGMVHELRILIDRRNALVKSYLVRRKNYATLSCKTRSRPIKESARWQKERTEGPIEQPQCGGGANWKVKSRLCEAVIVKGPNMLSTFDAFGTD